VLFVLFFAGCDREIPILESFGINGYEVQGTLTDQIGNPVPNASVYLDYTADLIDSGAVTTRRYLVQDPTVLVQAVVTNWSNQVIRVLTPRQYVNGWYEQIWDGKDSAGAVPPSGIYSVVYLVADTARFSYNQLVSGGQVASTDAHGFYTIPMENLPIDSSSVPLFSSYDSTYQGNLIISNSIILTYQYGSQIQQIQRTVDKGQVTIINVVFH